MHITRFQIILVTNLLYLRKMLSLLRITVITTSAVGAYSIKGEERASKKTPAAIHLCSNYFISFK